MLQLARHKTSTSGDREQLRKELPRVLTKLEMKMPLDWNTSYASSKMSYAYCCMRCTCTLTYDERMMAYVERMRRTLNVCNIRTTYYRTNNVCSIRLSYGPYYSLSGTSKCYASQHGYVAFFHFSNEADMAHCQCSHTDPESLNLKRPL